MELSSAFSTEGGALGRSTEKNRLILPDSENIISRWHGKISFENGAYHYTDTSTGGTFLANSGKWLGKGDSVKLNPGDVLRIGEYDISVAVSVDPDPSPAQSWGGGFPDTPAFEWNTGQGHGQPAAWDRDFSPPPPAGLESESPFPEFPSSLSATPSAEPFPFSEPSPPALDDWSFGLPPAPPVPTPVPAADWGADDWNHYFAPAPVDRDSVFAAQVEPSPPAPFPEAFPPQAPVVPGPIVPEPPAQPSSAVFAPQASAAPSPTLAESSAQPFPTAVSPQAPVVPSPTGSAQLQRGSPDLFRCFLQGAGLASLEEASGEDRPALMQAVGELFRAFVEGMLGALQARDKIKGEFRLARTVMRREDNNFLKIAANVDDTLNIEQSLKELLAGCRPGFKDPVESVREGFTDLNGHQLAMVAGMQAALTAALERFDPETFEKQCEDGIFGQKKAKCWETYTQAYPGLVREIREILFSEEFGEGYERQMRELQAAKAREADH